ncbi:hypothetical protein [Agarivorans sp. QJM3NY_25]|uniref:hypothetical protein n=1 Tax=Agarivorans sp. QJM3NY_25 TaxID=3421430 RepID=UPI003D7C4F88
MGGASVTVWRELRRLKKVCQFDETIQQAFKAADTANWKEFTKVNGRCVVQVSQQAVKGVLPTNRRYRNGRVQDQRYWLEYKTVANLT